MEEEEEICRVCRSEATPEQPLFHPCKCSGSIRYVHQDCLIEWLSHSRKKYCELCEHPFTFTPVYRQDMPEILPAKLFFVQIKKKLIGAISVTSRAILVSSVWLILLPYCTIWVWRFYFFLASNLSRYLSKLQTMTRQLDFSRNLTTIFSMTTFSNNHTNTSLLSTNTSSSSPSSSSWFQEYKSQLTLKSFLADCFEGQIITCIVIVIFIAVFLLREWIVQNIPMENPIIEEEEDVPVIPVRLDTLLEPQDQAIDNFFQQPTEETPPSPVAETYEASTSYKTSTRAASLPPSSSSSSSFQNEDNRRSASMEPYIHTNESSPNTHHDDARSVHPPNAPRMRHAEAPIPIVPEEAPPVAPPPANNDDDDEEEEEEENMEEFEGILEAIGMQGSLWNLVQNCSLMALLIALSLSVAVWMPYLIGMLFIISETLDLPLKLARLVADPLISYIVSRYMTNSSVVTSISGYMNATEPVFRRYQELATGQTAVDRFACIFLGYIIVTIISCWYLTRSANNMATAAFGRTAQETLRHQGIIFKVAMFIMIELVLFPIVCGFLLDVTTWPLFRSVTLAGRFYEHPVPSVFLHWFFGTGFMFLFAVMVTMCREVVRPGVMWFIRDPNDAQFHPIREIVERPILFQFRKIGASALIYITVIVIGVGGVVHFIDAFIPNILPLRLNLSNPISIVPIDHIAVQVCLPYLLKQLEPKLKVRYYFMRWTHYVSRHLRLSSFMFGGRYPEEEGSLVYHSWSAWIRRVKPSHYPTRGAIVNIEEDDVSYIWSGRLLRVPRHDSVPIIEGRRMLIPLDNYTYEPLDTFERRVGHPASTAPGGDETNTRVVYSPPGFKQRLLFLVGFMWLSIIVFVCSVTIVPVVLGRSVFHDDNVHDIYSFAAGWSIILGMRLLVNKVGDLFDNNEEFWNHAKKLGSQVFRWIFFIVSFGFIVPSSLGLLIQVYLVIPLQKFSDEPLSIAPVQMWTQGFACMWLIHGVIQLVPNSAFRDDLNDIFRHGIHQMKLEPCIKKLVGPLILISLSAIIIPFASVYIHMQIFARNNRELRIKFLQIVYPFSLIGIAMFYLGKFGSTIGVRLAQSIREDNYLVGRTLHNLEQ